ncbi:caspase recruitment domain-containing protein 8-like [Cololabis saira]|uniref:caspase recruitment domain-containing protein 8-like n=1 Tax=Cololabis saira TaxID=129043 RepID=UPI002AD55B50|nr:caspase recruitment domain-containing protein 8-like [Cololabis saira]
MSFRKKPRFLIRKDGLDWNQTDDGGPGELFSEETSSESSSEETQQREEEDSNLGEGCEPFIRMKPIPASNAPPSSGPLKLSTTGSCERKEKSCSRSRSSSFPSPTHEPSAESRALKRCGSFPAGNLSSSFEEFTPACSDESAGESYRFQCSRPGQYQCRETALVFHMKDGGQVLYRILPWSRSQLSPHHKKPAGPLFDIRCVKEGSMCQLHLPHCEIRSTGGCRFLSVAHVNDDGIQFIRPQKITETHVVINVTGFSCYGNVIDEASPSVPIRALVLPFYKPPQGPETKYRIAVLLLPKNVCLKHVKNTRKELFGDETYIETPPHCKLNPQQDYSLTTSPGGDSVEVQPTDAEFDQEYDDNYFPAFHVTYENMLEHIRLFLKDNTSHSVWDRQVSLPSSGLQRSVRSARLRLPTAERLLEVRSSLVERISESNLLKLLDKLLERRVINYDELETAKEKPNRGERTRCVVDTVRFKGQKASSEMIEILNDLDPFLCGDLALI